MNYRHAYHAGNFADVLKHATLALVIEHLKLKPAPFRVIDSHAGTGCYDLGSSEAARTGEWLGGIGRLIGPDAAPLPANVQALLEPYFRAIAACNAQDPATADRFYPGSPRVALELMRPVDRLIANELHPEDLKALQTSLGRDRRAKILSVDGWQALKAVLPPKERRGVILIDPPFEEAGEYQRLAQGLAAAVRRFATGTYILWFPIKDDVTALHFRETLLAAHYDKLLWVELAVRAPASDLKLSANGLVILNPPYRLDEQVQILLPFLADRLVQGPGARGHSMWLTRART